MNHLVIQDFRACTSVSIRYTDIPLVKTFRALSTVEQLAAHLRAEITSGSLRDALPGVHRLAREMAVSTKTVVAAVRQLEKEGLVVSQGERRRSLIQSHAQHKKEGLHVRVLRYDKGDENLPYLIDLMHRLREVGHQADYAPKSLQDLKMDPRKLARMVKAHPADVWIICAGSVDVLKWFADRPIPAFAMFGRMSGLDLPGVVPRKIPAMHAAVDRLVSLGHQRIVLLAREDHRVPEPALFEQAFLDRLRHHGIVVGSFNLPDWEETREGLSRILDSLFQYTPPTALFISEAQFFLGVYQYLAGRQIRVPEDLSLICTDPALSFDWCHLPVSHIEWNPKPVIRAVLKWLHGIVRGDEKKTQVRYRTKFIEGGTIGPARTRNG